MESSKLSPVIFVCCKFPQDPPLFLSGLGRSSKQAPRNRVYEHKVYMGSKASILAVTKSWAIAGLSVNNALESSQHLWAMILLWGENK